VIGSLAAGSTLALFSDTEESEDNVFTAGALDLKIDWTESYNGEEVETQQLTDNPGPVFSIDDVKPGDQGEATMSFHIEDNPAWLWMSTDLNNNSEVSVTEPESEAPGEDNSPGGDFGSMSGELAENINVRLWYDDEDDGATPGDNVYQESEEVIIGGTTEVCEPGDQRENLDVALTLDRPGSMQGVFTEVQDGSKLLVDDLATGDQSAAVSFASSASLDQELTTNKTAVKNEIDSLSASGSTNMAEGVETSSNELLNGANADASHDKVMVLLADGNPNRGDTNDPTQETIDAADDAKSNGIQVVTIAYTDGANETLMEELATSSDDFYVAGETNVTDIFTDIGEDIGECQQEGNATLADLHSLAQDGILLDGDTGTSGDQAFSGSQTQYIGFEWWVPKETGNVIQTDMVNFDMNFYAEQERHNTEPKNPWN